MDINSWNAVQDQIVKLQREIHALETVEKPEQEVGADTNRHEPMKKAVSSPPARRNRRLKVAPGVALTGLPGSLYTTVLRILVALGRLDQHDTLFIAFERADSKEAAKKLLKEIGVARSELEGYLRLDDEFQQHCEKRTLAYKKRAAAGDVKYQRILNDPKICDERQNWIGDLDEALSILYGGRRLSQVRRGRNQKILNRVKLMFDLAEFEGTSHCFLYKQKWHRAFKRAMALVQD